jgi:hypothetical protein
MIGSSLHSIVVSQYSSCDESISKELPVVDSERGKGDAPWVEFRSSELGIRVLVPPFAQPLPFRLDEHSGSSLAFGWEESREFVALARVPGSADGETVERWRTETDLLTKARDWIGAVVASPYAVDIDGARGHQGWLRYRDPHGQEFIAMLWVGRVQGDRVVVAYWCDTQRARSFVRRYRRILESISWERE